MVPGAAWILTARRGPGAAGMSPRIWARWTVRVRIAPIMKTFVTGASGFVGHAVCAELLTRGHEVTALVRRPAQSRRGPPRSGATWVTPIR